MIQYLFNHGRFQALLVALLIVSGLAAINGLPRTEDPRISNRLAIVTTALPGASAERVEVQVSEKIEQRLKSQAEVKHVSSISRPGLSVITVELKDEITHAPPVWSRMRDLLGDVRSQLPENAAQPLLDDERGYAYTRIVSVNARDDSITMATLNRYTKELQNQLRNVSGVELVHIFGQAEEEIRVTVDQQKASLAGISQAHIHAAIKGADAKVAAGTLTNDKSQMQIEVTGAFDSVARIGAIPVSSNHTASQYQLSDIADISRTIKTPVSEIALIDGKPGLYIAIRMLPKLRIDKFSDKIDVVVQQFELELPNQIELQNIFDQRGYTQERLGDLLGNIAVGFILILAVLFITLGFKAALIVGTALPLTVLFTLVSMHLYGLPIHQMSVTGLVVALGIMVDNAIVITDAVQRYRQQGLNAITAVEKAVAHFWLPLLGSTLTTILAFAPIALMPGASGEFIGGIALSVIFALIGSYIISHSLVVVFAGQFINNEQRTGIFYQGIRTPKLSKRFAATLKYSLAKPKLTLLLVFIFPVAGFFGAGQLTEQFFPPSDRDMFQIEVHFAPQVSIESTRQAIKEMDAHIRKSQGIEKLDWMIGTNFPSFYYNMMQRNRGANNYAQAMVKVTDFRRANELITALQHQLDSEFPHAQTLVRKLEQGPPFNAPIEMRIYGPNLDTLADLGQQLRTQLIAHNDITHTRPTLLSGSPKLWLNTDEAALTHAGLSLSGMATQLQSQFNGVVVGSIIDNTETVPVRVRVADNRRDDISSLFSTQLNTAANATQLNTTQPLLVESFASATLSPSRGSIARRDGERVNIIEAYLATGVLPQTVLNDVTATIAQSGFVLPHGYRLELGGESQKRNEAVGKLLGQVGIIVVLLITVLVMSFNSFTTTALILINALQAAMLGLLSVFIAGYPFGFTVIIGLLGLMGLAINAAIVILSELNSLQALTDKSKIVAAVMTCSRHISSTTITTVGGFLPLILAGGGFWPPFAVAIAGGTVLTTMLSFYFVPVAYYLLSKRKVHQSQVGP
ncbi:efflux RND transporter permease subunit [Pseudoalteromonas sp. NEC-BIFX-2020_015]|uniref:efflux RND transporter permease subunit n=1 Tax=Pseudoalteromonas sp. NEC-BIFX-2020_015 TaxID=2729544 RepID=UPI0014614828|nr:efflux RND transporter permease subunit [Pseudoalteromonas sp. NEC-BIFX-2020_015]NMR26000.1 efflux RND transporter permease subunit [Pseudoalteromonas sp. NEC-BIFX-2020_015]